MNVIRQVIVVSVVIVLSLALATGADGLNDLLMVLADVRVRGVSVNC